jgi:hypothetical protein
MATALQSLKCSQTDLMGLTIWISDFDTKQIFGALRFILPLFNYFHSVHDRLEATMLFPGRNRFSLFVKEPRQYVNSPAFCPIKARLGCPCVELIKHYVMKIYGRNGGIAPPFLISVLDGSVSFTPLPLYSWRKSPRYPLYRKLGEPRSAAKRCGGDKPLTSAVNRFKFVNLFAVFLTTLSVTHITQCRIAG